MQTYGFVGKVVGGEMETPGSHQARKLLIFMASMHAKQHGPRFLAFQTADQEWEPALCLHKVEIKERVRGVVVHTFNPSTREAEVGVGGSL